MSPWFELSTKKQGWTLERLKSKVEMMLIQGAPGQPNLEMNREDDDLGSRMPKISIGLDD